VCHKGTGRTQANSGIFRIGTLVLLGVIGALGQTAPDWRKVGGSAVDLQLAAPATGPVARVWFSADGSTLYAQTAPDKPGETGKVFRTSDFQTWSAAPDATDAAPSPSVTAVRRPEPNATLLASNSGSSRIFALGRQLWGSGDGGQTWLCLTAYKTAAVVGPGQRSVAVSPNNDQELVLANDFGVWRSMDGGLSWDGLNQLLPNLSVSRILSTPNGTAGTRVETDRLGALVLPPGGSVWQPTSARDVTAEARAMQNYSARVGGATITAVTAAGSIVYAGAEDGRMWVSDDGGQTFRSITPGGNTGQVKRIFVDPTASYSALAVVGGKGPRVFRTNLTGAVWDAIDGNLPDTPVNGITADRVAGAIYVATDKGVFYAHTDLEKYSSDPVVWTSLSDRLPPGASTAAASDVRLDPTGVQLYAALDGYGIYATPAPHRTLSPRVVNTADSSTRAAAPGSLLSVIGGRVNSATGGDLNYPVLAAADTESQIQVPFEAVGPNVDLRLETTAGSITRGVAVQPVSPAILLGHEGVPMLFDADSGLPLDAHNTAHSNGRMQIWATGLGKVRPDWPTGLPAPTENPPEVVAPVSAFLDGTPLQVTKATLVPGYVGFYVVEVQLPSINNLGPSELYISAGGQESNRVQVILEP
jgi:uncharacterized protein (TIGR03437 family)